MNFYDRIFKDALLLKKKYCTNDPHMILKERGVRLIPFSKNTKLLGMYKIIKRNRFVFYNPFIDKNMLKMVLAHELGHDLYHRKEAKKNDIPEFTLFDINTDMEYEANLFAANLLLDEDEIISHANMGYTYIQIAKIMNVNINLLLFKLNEMKKKGLKLNHFDYKINIFENI